MSAGQAPLGGWGLTLAGLAGLCALVASRRTGGWWLGWFAGAGYFAGSLNWIYEPFLVDAETYGWMAPFAVLLIAFGLGLFWAVAGSAAQRARWPLAGFAVALSLAELARSYVLTGFPWALIGHVWADTPVAQASALIGPVGLTLATCLAAAGIARMRPAAVAGGLALVAAGWGFGLWALDRPDPAAPGVRLRLVQPDAVQSMKWDPAQARFFFDRLLAFSGEPPAAGDPAPDLVVWPETSMPYLLESYPQLAGVIAAAGRGAPVVIGMQRLDGDIGYNTLGVIQPDGTVSARYDKWHLVPFGEYIPAGDLVYDWFGIRAFASQLGAGYTPGRGPELLDLGGRLGTVLPLICYEAVFPQDLRAAERAGVTAGVTAGDQPGGAGSVRPGWILQITNDAWFGTLTGPWQHLAQARLRAIEQGLPLARAANTGVSAMIDARGRVVRHLDLGQAGWLDVALPGALPPTVYARTGDGPVAVLLACLAAVLFPIRRRRSA